MSAHPNCPSCEVNRRMDQQLLDALSMPPVTSATNAPVDAQPLTLETIKQVMRELPAPPPALRATKALPPGVAVHLRRSFLGELPHGVVFFGLDFDPTEP